MLEFDRVGELLRRPVIAQSLQAERETFLGSILASVKELQDELSRNAQSQEITASQNADSNKTPYVSHGKNLPEQVDRIIWAGQLENRAIEQLKLADAMLSDLDSYAKVKQVGDRVSIYVVYLQVQVVDYLCCRTYHG